MTKKIILEKNQEHLEILKKEVPKYDWKLKRIKKESNWDKDGNPRFEDVTWFYHCEFEVDTPTKKPQSSRNDKYIRGEIEIKGDVDGISNVECLFEDEISWSNEQREHFDTKDEKKMWEEVREFFDKWLIPDSERIEKKLETPRFREMDYKIGRVYKHEYEKLMMKHIFEDDYISRWDDKNELYLHDERRFIENIHKGFNKDYSNKCKELGLDEEPYSDSVFDTIKYFIQDGLSDELEYYLEGKWDGLVEDLEQEKKWEEERKENQEIKNEG